MPDTSAAIAHSTEEIERAMTLARQDHEDGDLETRRRCDGILLAIAWARGKQGEAPITGTQPTEARPSRREIESEYRAAEDVLYRRQSLDVPDAIGFASGVEHTLLWLTGDTARPPLGGGQP